MGAALPADHDEQTLRYFARGHLYTEYVARQLEAKHGKENVHREVEIHHPLGVGHADIYLPNDRLLLEVKSTATPTTSSPMFDMAVAQLRFYLRFHPEAEQGALYLINPSDLSREDVFTVKLTDEDIVEIDMTVLDIVSALERQDPPARVCAKPSQARSRMCPFADTCFHGWEPPPTNESDDPALVELVTAIAQAKAAERVEAARVKELEEARKSLEAQLADLVDVGDTRVGNYMVKRTHIERSPSFSIKAAEAAGFPVQTLEEFMRPGASYDTFRVTQVSESEGADVDFGEVPF